MFYTTKGDDGSEIDREWAQGDSSQTKGMFFSHFPPFLTVLIHFSYLYRMTGNNHNH